MQGVLVVVKPLCIAYKSIFEILIKQQTIYYMLIISKIKQ